MSNKIEWCHKFDAGDPSTYTEINGKVTEFKSIDRAITDEEAIAITSDCKKPTLWARIMKLIKRR